RRSAHANAPPRLAGRSETSAIQSTRTASPARGARMLTRADDYPVHQTADPVAFVASGDRNFYDRYFFHGYAPDGQLFFAVALGVYPNRHVMDAAVSAVYRGRQVVVRASRRAPLDRVETNVGPITVQVIEPLRRVKVRLAKNDYGLELEAEFAARGP